MKGSFEGRVAVITCGAQGIGRAIADGFRREGARVYTEMTLFLCSDKAGFITGENICIDGGMTRLMIYHGEHGWEYRTRGKE